MKFGPVPVSDAAGLITAHSLRSGEMSLRKGATITADIAATLAAEGIREVVAVALDAGDVGEDEAAGQLASVLAGDHVRVETPFTGRSNLFATVTGVLHIDRERIETANGVDESITVATLPVFKPITAGEMVATVKIIPYAVPGTTLARACAGPERSIGVAPYRRMRVGVVSTRLPALKTSTIDKTLRVLGERLAPTGAGIVAERRVDHTSDGVAAGLADVIDGAGADIAVVFGASAIADRRDVIPAGIVRAGGQVDHFGMPVDPGNLLLLGRRGDVPVIGAPGCARSPKENGFDWILHRLLADVPVSRADIVALGVGGLLMEIVSRPQPRAGGTADGAADE